MHKGVFVGSNAENRNKRILILGESHHISKTDDKNSEKFKPATYDTKCVVREHIEDITNTKKSLHFFQKIGNAFGFPMETEDEKNAFWENFYFGNYIDVLCGIKDGATGEYLAQKDDNGITNRQKMNDDLFEFVNDNNIDVIVCFSRKVFDNLPSLTLKEEDKPNANNDAIMVGRQKDYIGHCVYLPNTNHKNTSVILNRELNAYSLRHPSARGGFCPENYADALSKLLK